MVALSCKERKVSIFIKKLPSRMIDGSCNMRNTKDPTKQLNIIVFIVLWRWFSNLTRKSHYPWQINIKEKNQCSHCNYIWEESLLFQQCPYDLSSHGVSLDGPANLFSLCDISLAICSIMAASLSLKSNKMATLVASSWHFIKNMRETNHGIDIRLTTSVNNIIKNSII